MLDNPTKTRINSTRDILVGKVPDPKAQVEQITTALIYKFMHDMDQESVELGGKPAFFIEEYAQYDWAKLMDKSLGGHARLDLYVRALDQMSHPTPRGADSPSAPVRGAIFAIFGYNKIVESCKVGEPVI